MALAVSVLSGVRQPVQLVWGDHDPMGSTKVARQVAETLPDAELHILEGGHAPWLTQPDKVAALATAFLERHRAIHCAESARAQAFRRDGQPNAASPGGIEHQFRAEW